MGAPLQKQTCYKRIIPSSKKDVLVPVFASVSGISLLPRALFSQWHGRPHLGPVARVIHIDSYFMTQQVSLFKLKFSLSTFNSLSNFKQPKFLATLSFLHNVT